MRVSERWVHKVMTFMMHYKVLARKKILSIIKIVYIKTKKKNAIKFKIFKILKAQEIIIAYH